MIKVKFDTVVATDPCKMQETGEKVLVVGKKYKITRRGGKTIDIVDEERLTHTFTHSGDETELFVNQYVKPVDVEILEASGKVRLNSEGLEYFVGWFSGPFFKTLEKGARKKFRNNKKFKIVETDRYSVRLKYKSQKWWVLASMVDARDIIVEG